MTLRAGGWPRAGAIGTATAPRDWVRLLLLLLVVTAWRWTTREALELDLQFDEAQYAAWSYEPAFGYFSKPPVVAWAIGAARAVCGASNFCVRLPAGLAMMAATALVFELARRLAGPAAALPAAALFLLAPLNAVLGSFMTTDSMLVLAWAAAVCALLRAVQTDRLLWWAATGAAAGFGLLSKYSMGIFALSAAGFLLGDARFRGRLAGPGPWLGCAVAAAMFAPNLLWNASHGFATLGHTAHIAAPDQTRFGPQVLLRVLTFVAEQFGVFGPPAMLALVLAWIAAAQTGRAAQVPAAAPAPAAGWPPWSPRDSARLLLWCSLPFFAVITLQAAAARAHANWAAPTFVTGAILAGAWLARRPARWLVVALAFDVAIVLLAFHGRPLVQLVGITLPRSLDPIPRLQGWAPLGQAVAAVVQAQPPGTRLVTDERALLALMSVYARPASIDARVWNPGREVDNHFRLTREVAASPQGPFVIIAEPDLGAALALDFAQLEPLPPIRAAGRTLRAWRAARFTGYHAP